MDYGGDGGTLSTGSSGRFAAGASPSLKYVQTVVH